VVLVVLVARQSGPVPGAHHLQSSLRVGNLVRSEASAPPPSNYISQHAITDITDTVGGKGRGGRGGTKQLGFMGRGGYSHIK